MFFPLILLYGGLFALVVTLSLQSATPWQDPRFKRLWWRVMLYPAILMSVVMLAFAGLSRFIDFGFTWAIFVIVPALLIILVGIVKLAGIMAGDVRKSLNKPAILVIEKEKTS